MIESSVKISAFLNYVFFGIKLLTCFVITVLSSFK